MNTSMLVVNKKRYSAKCNDISDISLYLFTAVTKQIKWIVSVFIYLKMFFYPFERVFLFLFLRIYSYNVCSRLLFFKMLLRWLATCHFLLTLTHVCISSQQQQQLRVLSQRVWLNHLKRNQRTLWLTLTFVMIHSRDLLPSAGRAHCSRQTLVEKAERKAEL